MKRSNLFLALTTGCLAIASFAFAKMRSHSTLHTGWCTSSNNHCTVKTVIAGNVLTTAVNSVRKLCANGKTAHLTKTTPANCITAKVLYITTPD